MMKLPKMPGSSQVATEGFVNLPNTITSIRILLAPAVVWFLLIDNQADGPLRFWAALVFIVAIASDGLDGYIARSRNLVTNLGKILDPIADKALTSGALIGLAVLNELPWWVVALILVRELGITFWRLIEVRRGNIVPASRGGKIKTLAQSAAIILSLLPWWHLAGSLAHVVNAVFMSAAVVLTLWSGFVYLRDAISIQRGV